MSEILHWSEVVIDGQLPALVERLQGSFAFGRKWATLFDSARTAGIPETTVVEAMVNAAGGGEYWDPVFAYRSTAALLYRVANPDRTDDERRSMVAVERQRLAAVKGEYADYSQSLDAFGRIHLAPLLSHLRSAEELLVNIFPEYLREE